MIRNFRRFVLNVSVSCQLGLKIAPATKHDFYRFSPNFVLIRLSRAFKLSEPSFWFLRVH